MEHILFLVHRIPYPPNKGDKIRSFHLLKELSKHYHVHLGCFVDDDADWCYQSEFDNFCASHCCLPLGRKSAYLRGLTALVRGGPITVPFYRAGAMRRWTRETISQHRISRSLVFSSSMAQYVDTAELAQTHRIIDFVDVDSDKWGQYADKAQGPMRWIYRREQRELLAYETRIADGFNQSLFVSEQEAALFRQLIPAEIGHKVRGMANGVDAVYFDATADYPRPSGLQSRYIAFTGAMDYWANVDAVKWFCEQVWPAIHQQYPDLQFAIVGGNPTEEVQQLARETNVIVTGRVDDIRPYIAHADLIVAPLRIARGIQNKVLEALAMAKPIIATSMAMEGINAPEELTVCIADDGAAFANACSSFLEHPHADSDATNRQWVIEEFGWEGCLKDLQPLIEGKLA